MRTARPTQRAISDAVSKARVARGELLLAVLDDEDSVRRCQEDQPESPVLWWSSDLARERHRRCNHDWVGPDIALLEYDPDPGAVVDPSVTLGRLRGSIPERAVLCFYSEILAALPPEADQVGELQAAHGSHPIWRIRRNGHDVAVFHPGVGAPLAAAFLEEAIVLGARKVVACGGCGVLTPEVPAGQVIVPTEAVRDEGTSFHYLRASYRRS